MWKPDFGPASFNAKSGVVTVGAREFLIAYNVNLNSSTKASASDLAFEIREKGRAVRTDQTSPYYSSGRVLNYRPSRNEWPCGADGEVFDSAEALDSHMQSAHDTTLAEELKRFGRNINDLEGRNVMKVGTFSDCRAVGWVIPEYNRAQISINLTNYHNTSAHDVLEECRRLATDRGLIVTGSEVVGMVPYQAIRESGDEYLRRQGATRGLPFSDVVETAVQSMGLRDVAPFEAEKSVLGLPSTSGPLSSMSINDFADEVSRPSPAPGGGSIAAVAGSLAASLGSMVANLTFQKPALSAYRDEMEAIAIEAQQVKDDLLRAIDADTDAFNDVLTAVRLPKGTDQEKTVRTNAIQEGYKAATQVPLNTAQLCLAAMKLCRQAAENGLPASLTDAAVGCLMAHAGIIGAVYNVRINLCEITDASWADNVHSQLSSMVEMADSGAADIRTLVNSRL
jgi:glutamate formiminotransferase/formiminotetrahydrofolate cyclodeaminase